MRLMRPVVFVQRRFALRCQFALACLLFCAQAMAGHKEPVTPTLANSYREGVAVDTYWVSEKYDGVRALWNGQQLHTRQGLPIAAPEWFTRDWPAIALDGELWAGRGRFDHVQSAVAQSTPNPAQWLQIRFMAFDSPGTAGPFSQRQRIAQTQLDAAHSPYATWAPHWRAASHTELMQQLHDKTQEGAEGLMLRHEDAPYRSGRSDDLLKLKLFEDAEAVVIGHVPGKGKYVGMVGALQVRDAQGREFRIGSGLTDALRRDPPPIGTSVTYRFNGTHPSGLPRFARFWRVRNAP